MLSDTKFEEWCKRLNLSEKAKEEIRHIRSSPPARRVQSRAGNVRGVFNQSRKMDHSVQYESRTVEGPAILMLEYATMTSLSSGTNLLPSPLATRGRTEGHSATSTRRTSSCSARTQPGGKSGNPKISCLSCRKRAPTDIS